MTQPNNLSILAIHAHPDDIEFQCAGVLALLKDRGCQISIVTMTPGDCGSAEHSADEIAAIRRGEGQAAAELLGAKYTCLEFRDLSIVVDNDSKRRVTELVRRVRPDIVFTAPPLDYMSDHEATSQLVRDACFNASVPNYVTRQWDPAARTTRIPHLYYVDAIDGVDYFGNIIQPGFRVDITSTYELKEKMLACHESQRNWLRTQHGVDEYLNACRRNSERHGAAIECQFAEGFRQHTGHPFPANNLLLEILGE